MCTQSGVAGGGIAKPLLILIADDALNQEIAMQLLRRLLREEEEPSTLEGHARAPLPRALSQREVEVLQLVASGLTNQQIARKLLLSVSTVKKYLRRILSKLEVSDRAQAAIKALKLGLLNEQAGQQQAPIVAFFWYRSGS
jgi:DNA-binding NarL/FixJ family response regulator